MFRIPECKPHLPNLSSQSMINIIALYIVSFWRCSNQCQAANNGIFVDRLRDQAVNTATLAAAAAAAPDGSEEHSTFIIKENPSNLTMMQLLDERDCDCEAWTEICDAEIQQRIIRFNSDSSTTISFESSLNRDEWYHIKILPINSLSRLERDVCIKFSFWALDRENQSKLIGTLKAREITGTSVDILFHLKALYFQSVTLQVLQDGTRSDRYNSVKFPDDKIQRMEMEWDVPDGKLVLPSIVNIGKIMSVSKKRWKLWNTRASSNRSAEKLNLVLHK